jgi:hypothetical protein
MLCQVDLGYVRLVHVNLVSLGYVSLFQVTSSFQVRSYFQVRHGYFRLR